MLFDLLSSKPPSIKRRRYVVRLIKLKRDIPPTICLKNDFSLTLAPLHTYVPPTTNQEYIPQHTTSVIFDFSHHYKYWQCLSGSPDKDTLLSVLTCECQLHMNNSAQPGEAKSSGWYQFSNTFDMFGFIRREINNSLGGNKRLLWHIKWIERHVKRIT